MTTDVSNNDKITFGAPRNDIQPESSSIYQLVVQHQPPGFVYIGEPFNIDFIVVQDGHDDNELANATSPVSSQQESTNNNPWKENATIVESSNSTIPSFEIFTELLPIVTDVAVDNPETNVAMTASGNVLLNTISANTTIRNSNASSRSLVTVSRSHQERHTNPSLFRLNVLQSPSPISLGEFGTIQCSITGNSSHDGDDREDHTLSLNQQKYDGTTQLRSPKPQAPVLWDDRPKMYQIRLTAFRFGNDGKLNRNRRGTELHPLTSDPITQCCTISNVTSSITIVLYKLLITSCNNEGSSHRNTTTKNQKITEKDWNPTWYKDEGGRDKCIEIIVSVYSRQQVALFEPIPLMLTLCYATSNQQKSLKSSPASILSQLPTPVNNQDILNVLYPKPTDLFVIDRTTGTMKIRFRIEDVSKNHQGQDFCLLIAAALDNDSYHALHNNLHPSMIAPVASLSINVRSKRNKRPRHLSTISSNMSIPASDVSSEYVHQGNDAAPFMTTLLSPTMSAAAIVENHPNITMLQLQYALRSVVQWMDEVVSTTTYEIQRQQARNDIPNQHWSSMTQSLSAYHTHVRQQLNILQNIILFNRTSPTKRAQPGISDQNVPSVMYRNSHDTTYQRTSPTAEDYIRYRDAGLGHYQQATISNSGGNAYPYPYLYQNQFYQSTPHAYQNRHAISNDSRSLPIAADASTQASTMEATHNGPYGYMYASNERDIREHANIDESSIVVKIHDELQPHHGIGKKSQSRSTQVVETKYRSSTEENRVTYNSKRDETLQKHPFAEVKHRTKNANVAIKEEQEENRENEVEHIFAKQFKSLRTGALLGYPAYTINKELIGFYHQRHASKQRPIDVTLGSSSSSLFTGNHSFVSVQKEDFGVKELEHAKVVFDQADRSAIQSLSHCGSIETMLHCAFVYEWSEGLGNV